MILLDIALQRERNLPSFRFGGVYDVAYQMNVLYVILETPAFNSEAEGYIVIKKLLL